MIRWVILAHGEGLKSGQVGNSAHGEGLKSVQVGNSADREGLKSGQVGNSAHGEGLKSGQVGNSCPWSGSGRVGRWVMHARPQGLEEWAGGFCIPMLIV